VVGRELPDTICPHGEDHHQGHDGVGKVMVDGIDNRGSNTTDGLRSLTRILRIIKAFVWTIGVMRQSVLLPTNCVLLV
jgi:hypothetical protein